MKYYLLKFSRDWADEFNCDGFMAIDEAEKIKQESIFMHPSIKGEYVYFGFGTNEGWEGEFTFAELWTNILTISEISEEEYNTVRKLFGTSSYGIFPEIYDLLDGIVDNLEDNGEDDELLEEVKKMMGYDDE